jgi:predicted nuclease of restriction endonuclease-like RecB superfamily
MLVGKQVRVRFGRDRITPQYLDPTDTGWRDVAETLLTLFRGQEGRTRGTLEEDIKEAFGDAPGQLVHQGLAKLLEDRCEFDVVSGRPPDELREAVFRAAVEHRRRPAADGALVAPPFNRDEVLTGVARAFEMSVEAVDQGLFADLKSEQRLVRFKDTTAERLLHRYNVALAQSVLLRATGVDIEIRGETPARLRQIFRQIKFHRLVCEVKPQGKKGVRLHLDGPLSLFSATQKYGLQLALFLPVLLLCKDFTLTAVVLWGPQRKRRSFVLSSKDGLVTHDADRGSYVPGELTMFAELFAKRITDWELKEETDVQVLGGGSFFWVPDFRLVHRESGQSVLLEVLGFWRRSSAEQHLQRLREHTTEPFLLAVSDQLRIEEEELEGLPAGIHRFRQMPLPDEVAKLASQALKPKD